MPQFIGSRPVSVQLVPHWTVGGVQVVPQTRAGPASAFGTHICGAVQPVPHAPQFAFVVSVASQPLASIPSQSPRPGSHASTQRPATHCAPADKAPVRTLQSRVHEPQRSGVFVASHAAPHRSVPVGQPASASFARSSGTSVTSPSMRTVASASARTRSALASR
jgi:hypothetical protein